MKNRTNVAPWIIFGALCVGAFCAPWILPWAEAQRTGYVEKTASGAFANQLAPNPAAGLVLTPVGTDTSKVQWGTSGSSLPPGTTPGEVLGVVALTATRTMVTTGSQTSIGTQTYSYTQAVTGTATATSTATGATGTYTMTATGTSTGMSTSGELTVEAGPRGLAINGTTLYVVSGTAAKMSTVSIANPASMSLINTYNTCASPLSVTRWFNSALHPCTDGNAYLWGCSDPNACTLAHSYTVGTTSYVVANHLGINDYALVTNYGANTVSVLDVYNATTPGTTSALSGCGAWGVATLSYQWAVVTCNTNGRVYGLNYSTPSSPTWSTGYASTGLTSPRQVYAWGGRYASVTDFGGNQVSIVDFNDPNNPSIIGSVSTGASSGPTAIAGQGAYVYVVLDTAGTMKAIDVSTPSSPSVIGTVTVGTNPRGIAVSGDWAFVSVFGENKVKSINISRFITTTGTQTTTNTRTVTQTVTNTSTTTTTGTQTVAGTSVFTASATGTGTGTGVEVKWVPPTFDPMGTFFFDTCTGECAVVYPFRLNSLSRIQDYVSHSPGSSPRTLTATCSTGSDEPLHNEDMPADFVIAPSETEKKTTGYLWPAGAWLSRLRAKVNANGAAIRVHVYEISSTYPFPATEWFNFTTGDFANTDWATIEKLSLQEQRIPSASTNYIGFRFYATCSTETTVSLEFGDAALTTRIESPIVTDRIYAEDVWGLAEALATKEPVISYGYPKQIVAYTGTDTYATTSKGPIDFPTIAAGDGVTWKHTVNTGTSTATATATALNPMTATSPTLTLAPRPVTFACSAITTDQTLSSALTLGIAYGVMVSVGPITPRASTTALRLRVSYSGRGTGGVATANVEAMTGDAGSPSNVMWVPNAWIYETTASGDYTTGYNDAITWDAHWSSATTFKLRMTGILMPFSSGAAGTRACLEVEELSL
jgi:hypothetical protein